MKTAIVIGSTGLVGKEIISELLRREEVDKVISFSRRPTGIEHEKFREEVVSFDHINEWASKIKGDILFSALGTTLKAAGSKEAQYLVDHDYQLNVARAAADNNIKTYVLISSFRAHSESKFFYLRMKGELEEEVKKLTFSSVFILRPGPLKGLRAVKRTSETISLGLLEKIPRGLLPVSSRPVEGRQVAQVAVDCGLSKSDGLIILEPRAILKE